QADLPIEATTREHVSVRMAGYCKHWSRMQKCLEVCPMEIPDPNRRIFACTGKDLSVASKGDTMDAIGMPPYPEQISTLYVPQFHQAIPTSTGKESPVRAKGERLDDISMSLPDEMQSPTALIPDPYFPLHTARSPEFPIRADCY